MKSYLAVVVWLFVAGSLFAQEEAKRELTPGRYVLITYFDGPNQSGLANDPVIVNIKKDGDGLAMTAEDKRSTVGPVTMEEGKYVFDLRYRDPKDDVFGRQNLLLTFAGHYPREKYLGFIGVFAWTSLENLNTRTGSFTLFPIDPKK